MYTILRTSYVVGEPNFLYPLDSMIEEKGKKNRKPREDEKKRTQDGDRVQRRDRE